MGSNTKSWIFGSGPLRWAARGTGNQIRGSHSVGKVTFEWVTYVSGGPGGKWDHAAASAPQEVLGLARLQVRPCGARAGAHGRCRRRECGRCLSRRRRVARAHWFSQQRAWFARQERVVRAVPAAPASRMRWIEIAEHSPPHRTTAFTRVSCAVRFVGLSRFRSSRSRAPRGTSEDAPTDISCVAESPRRIALKAARFL